MASADKLWFVKVKFLKEPRKEEIVPVSAIRRQGATPRSRKSFEPRSLQDFKKNEWYWVKTMMDSSDGNAHSYPAVLGEIFGELEVMISQLLLVIT